MPWKLPSLILEMTDLYLLLSLTLPHAQPQFQLVMVPRTSETEKNTVTGEPPDTRPTSGDNPSLGFTPSYPVRTSFPMLLHQLFLPHEWTFVILFGASVRLTAHLGEALLDTLIPMPAGPRPSSTPSSSGLLQPSLCPHH